MPQELKNIILFDGVCNLCNSTVQFVIRHDKHDLFRFASLQSETGRRETVRWHIDRKKTDSIVLIKNNRCYVKSTAALHIFKELPGYGWMRMFFIVPVLIRDFVYDLIAKNRYKWFGKRNECMIPTPELQSKFLE